MMHLKIMKGRRSTQAKKCSPLKMSITDEDSKITKKESEISYIDESDVEKVDID